VLSKLHTHPFVGGDFLSAGDLYHGVTSTKAIAWRERRGLATALLHVVYPNDQPLVAGLPWKVEAAGARARGADREVAWRIRTWGTDGQGSVVDLGDAEIVPDRHTVVRAARRAPYWATRRGGRWCDAQKQALREAGYGVSRNLLGRGWRRYLVGSHGRHLLLALPPDFPACAPRVLDIEDATVNAFRALPLPQWAEAARSLRDVSLPRLVQHYI
jgi:hypothetical protein